RRYQTPIGTFSIHHLAPDFFFGFERDRTNVPIAVPEKALLDVLYLSQTKTRLFVRLPELDLPKNFSWQKAAECEGKTRRAETPNSWPSIKSGAFATRIRVAVKESVTIAKRYRCLQFFLDYRSSVRK